MKTLRDAPRDRLPSVPELNHLVRIRLDDAWLLLKNGDPVSRLAALYLGGYAVECALKACLCRRYGYRLLPKDHWIHDLLVLAQRAGEWASFDSGRRAQLLELNRVWSVDLRYFTTPEDASAISIFIKKAEDFAYACLRRTA